MPELSTLLRSFLSTSVMAGAGMSMMGLGVVPVDPGVEAVAQIFIGPLGIPTRIFLSILGPAKILGVLSLWEKGPLPKKVGMAGLSLSALCASIGHFKLGEKGTGLAAATYVAVMGALYMIEQKKEEEVKKL